MTKKNTKPGNLGACQAATPVQDQSRTQKLIASIKSLHSVLDRLADQFRTDSTTGKEYPFDKFSPDNWRRNTYGNVLVRLRQLVESNFNYIESLGILAVARFIFEVSVWLRLFQRNGNFCMVYYRELLQTRKRYYEDTLAHLRDEIILLKEFEAQDEKAAERVIHGSQKAGSGDDIAIMIGNAVAEVDAKASRRFSLYLDDARTNGYGFQAHLVEKQAIPKAERALERIAEEIQEFNRRVPADIRNLASGRWQWRTMANLAGIENEHDYIYSYASKLLHATPASITTDQKNLEMAEMRLFARYIHAKLLEIIELARNQPEYTEK
jgi:hypothetical protein